MKPILLGIDSLSYSSFLKCNPRVLGTLFGSTYRGVVVNKDSKKPFAAWAKVLGMKEIPQSFLNDLKPESIPLIEQTKAIPINIPITNPSMGEVSFSITEADLDEELKAVGDAILENAKNRPVIASITSFEVMLSKSEKCGLYSKIDSFLGKVLSKADDFILFSPYGEPKGGSVEDYGIFLASVPRPSEHETVKLEEIGSLFNKLVKGEAFY
ncbi:hypothetical protein [Sulfuracidifex metallicus]|uniref:Uncharacterized protein n=1 Tax=Sulfuracidifex metallicus DSM 6482 = JCM 9184 TaxID=523847 RepID=A0A6A9QJ85_SULME|nr:hypothetical protein [Sulfuracidifex metallicus]MUN29347.1 hypothetical protein [Sulfuracidifex metallicus DSM 6482 = JCM 9184]WOE50142.1 hypothetical protein RQ359_001645 [Sulfuracidifex metallicus DSM 6482 = JCM 9184]